MQEKPRVGLVLMRAAWKDCAQADDLLEAFEASARTMAVKLERCCSVAGPWVVDSPETLAACRSALKQAELDMVLLAFQSWTEDALLVGLLESIGGRPLVLWCSLPWRRMPRPASFREVQRSTGPASAFSALGTLRNLDFPYLFTWGSVDDPRLLRDLEVAGRAAAARSALRFARFGLLPDHKTNARASDVDEARLLADLGPVVETIPLESFRRAAEEIDQEDVRAYLDAFRSAYEIDHVPNDQLEMAARASLGLARLAKESRLDLIALNDASRDLYEAFQMRLALYPHLPGSTSEDAAQVMYQPEADLSAATANFILNRLTGSPTMFLEFWAWDEALNQLVGGHNGMQNPAVGAEGEVWISHDYDSCRDPLRTGAQIQMIARPGRVTLFQLRSTPAGWQAVAASGFCLESRPVIEGYPHALVRIDTPVEHFFNRLADVGATQHWIMAYGSVLHEIEAFCQMTKIRLEVLRY